LIFGRREFVAGVSTAVIADRARAAGDAVRRRVPFRAGRSDLDSGIACARMAMSFFEPTQHFPVADLMEMTAHDGGHWFFEPQLIPIMRQKGRKVELFSDLDYDAIAAAGGLERFGPDAGKMIDRSALRWALDKGAATAKRPALDLPDLLERFRTGGFLMIVADRGVLRRDRTLPYLRFHLVVTGFAGGIVRIHDPGRGPNFEMPLSPLSDAFGRPAAGRSALLII